MSQQEMITLKLQMGIDPSVQIAPGVLLAMWQQLNLENVQAKRNESRKISNPGHMIFNPIVG
ncbi:MAG: hypothetical protein WBN41_01140 [Lysobacterales bacterium]